MIHEIVNSDWFLFIIGAATIVGALAAILAVMRINTVITQNRTDSNQIKRQSQTATGSQIMQAGRDNHGGRYHDS